MLLEGKQTSRSLRLLKSNRHLRVSLNSSTSLAFSRVRAFTRASNFNTSCLNFQKIKQFYTDNATIELDPGAFALGDALEKIEDEGNMLSEPITYGIKEPFF